MAKMLIKANALRGLVLVVAVVAAALNAKGIRVHTDGFFDGPH